MNHLLIGTIDTSRLLAAAGRRFLLIDDGPIADAFLAHFSEAKLFDVSEHTFDPLRDIDYKRARDFAAALYTASPEGKDTLTVRNGRRALTRLLLEHPKRLDELPRDGKDPGVVEAIATVEDILLSPVLRRVLCNPTNFRFKGGVVVKLDRALLGDFDAFVLASLIIAQFTGPIIITDFGFYGREFHVALMRQNRLIAGVHFLAELPLPLRNAVLLIEDKEGRHCLPEDAETLARYKGYLPSESRFGDFVRERTK